MTVERTNPVRKSSAGGGANVGLDNGSAQQPSRSAERGEPSRAVDRAGQTTYETASTRAASRTQGPSEARPSYRIREPGGPGMGVSLRSGKRCTASLATRNDSFVPTALYATGITSHAQDDGPTHAHDFHAACRVDDNIVAGVRVQREMYTQFPGPGQTITQGRDKRRFDVANYELVVGTTEKLGPDMSLSVQGALGVEASGGKFGHDLQLVYHNVRNDLLSEGLGKSARTDKLPAAGPDLLVGPTAALQASFIWNLSEHAAFHADAGARAALVLNKAYATVGWESHWAADNGPFIGAYVGYRATWLGSNRDNFPGGPGTGPIAGIQAGWRFNGGEARLSYDVNTDGVTANPLDPKGHTLTAGIRFSF